MTSKDALRAKLNKNPVKDTRVAVSESKWTHHILCQGHYFCFWHFGFLEVESLQFLGEFTFECTIFMVCTLSSKKGSDAPYTDEDLVIAIFGVAVRQQYQPWLWQL